MIRAQLAPQPVNNTGGFFVCKIFYVFFADPGARAVLY